MTSAAVLGLYDPPKPVTVSVDASQRGLGAVMLQNERPVEFALCALTETQQRYAQIEKEMLAMQYGLTRFHQYVYGQVVTVETDHKQLLGIKQKPITDVSPRLQRMRLHCQPFNYNLMYKPSKDLVLADTLSRAYLSNVTDQTDKLDTEQMHGVYMYTMTSDMSRERIRTATDSDRGLTLLKQTMMNGWPQDKKLCPEAVKPY